MISRNLLLTKHLVKRPRAYVIDAKMVELCCPQTSSKYVVAFDQG
jgi:hypothetical protein